MNAADDGRLLRLREALGAHEREHQWLAQADLVWLGVNRERVDARLRDVSGREHHVVARDNGSELAILLVLTEPDDVPARTPVVVVVNGPSGSGKSTLLRALAEASVIPWITFDEPILGDTDQPILVWRERAPQVHAGFIAGVAAVASAGCAVAVSAGGHPQTLFQEMLGKVRTVYVGLDCPLDVLIERELERDDRWVGLARQSANVHHGWSYDLRIDTTATGAQAAARAVLAAIE